MNEEKQSYIGRVWVRTRNHVIIYVLYFYYNLSHIILLSFPSLTIFFANITGKPPFETVQAILHVAPEIFRVPHEEWPEQFRKEVFL